jgi:hypothetical protein
MAKRKRTRRVRSVVEIILNDDGTQTVKRSGSLRPRELTPEELRPWLDLAYEAMQRKAAAAAQARPAKGHKKAVKRKQNQTKLAKRKTRRG